MVDYSKLPIDDTDAAARAVAHAQTDPFPSVPCALLSSAEIYDYALRTGMLYPFDKEALKPASYEAHIGGSAIWWDEQGKKHEKEIKRGEPFRLAPNSITFVQVEPHFRLPNYIAIRFNLRITHVHRGLLLGTGPLVDPGFEGKILIPLHNLTSTDYDIDTSEALIWIEFTKTSYGIQPSELYASNPRYVRGFPQGKKNLTPNQYLRKANAGNAIRSSIPPAINEAVKAAKTARSIVLGIGGFAIVGLFIALAALYFQVYATVQNSISLSTSVEQSLAPLAADQKSMADKLSMTEKALDKLDARVAQLKPSGAQEELDKLSAQVAELRRDLDSLRASTQPSKIKK